MDISLILPVYNVEKYLSRCIESCVNQKEIGNLNYEIIIVNDGTKDNSLFIAKSYEAKYPDLIKLYSQKNAGLSETRNNGIKYASGKFVWFIDTDDWIDEYSLKTLRPYLNNHNDMIIICAFHVKESGNLIGRQHFKEEKQLSGVEAFSLKVELNQTAPYAIFRKDFLLENDLKFYEGILHEDLEFCPRASYYAKNIVYLPNGLYYNFKLPRVSITSTVNPKRAFDLLKVIESLNEFSEKIVTNIMVKQRFFNLESIAINNALHIINQCDKSKKIEFIKAYNENQSIYNSILKKSELKFKLEAILFKIFPNKIIQIYNILQKLKASAKL